MIKSKQGFITFTVRLQMTNMKLVPEFHTKNSNPSNAHQTHKILVTETYQWRHCSWNYVLYLWRMKTTNECVGW